MAVNYQKAFKSLVLFLSSTPGRDKSCRLVQYLAGLISHYIKNASNLSEQQKKELSNFTQNLDKLYANMSLTRKVLRFGRPIGILMGVNDMLKTLKNINKDQMTEEQQFQLKHLPFKILANLSTSGYFLSDHFLYLSKIQLLNNPNVTNISDKLADRFWLLEVIFSLIANIIEYSHLNKKLSQEVDEEQKAILQEKIKQNQIDSARNLCDIPVIIGFMYPNLVNRVKLNFFGVITSYIGCYQNWK